MAVAIFALLASGSFSSSPLNDGLDCYVESGYDYPSLWNTTALRICKGPPRKEKICIVGAGLSGLHLGWLLKRRGYENTVVFEENNRTGGKAFTLLGGVGGDGITREAGAAFLSTDYYEVRGLIQRYNQTEELVSVSKEIHFHWNSTVGRGTQWANDLVSQYTGKTDPAVNNAIVGAALQKYFKIHAEIFGNYKGRFPPKPQNMSNINGTIVDFLKNNQLEVLHTFFYQFFTMQGMGILDDMPLYYVLKWCNPTSIQGGGFGNLDTPLALLKEGFGSIGNAMASEVDLAINLNTRVTSIVRSDGMATITTEPTTNPANGVAESEEHECDIVVLTGPIPQYVRGSLDATVNPILMPPTSEEFEHFSTMRPMQFLITIAELEAVPADYETLEYWPDSFVKSAEVIVHRNIEFAELNMSGNIGGIQSYSYYPTPTCNKSMHLAGQQRWLQQQGLKLKQVLKQFYCDSYLFHWNVEEVMQGKPWQLDSMQSQNHTLYVGGAAGYETVEDSFEFNLRLVNQLFDSSPNPPSTKQPVMEQFSVLLDCSDVDQYLAADNQTWTQFLQTVPAFRWKQVMVDTMFNKSAPTANSNTNINTNNGGGMCSIWTQIKWASRLEWKAIPVSELENTQNAFVQAYGSSVTLHPFPTSEGSNILLEFEEEGSTSSNDKKGGAYFNDKKGGTSSRTTFSTSNSTARPGSDQAAHEIMFYNISCDRVGDFVAADNATWLQFLRQQPGFLRHYSLMTPDSSTEPAKIRNCTVWVVTEWESYVLWKSVPLDGLARTAAAFYDAFGKTVTLHRYPTAEGLTVLESLYPTPPGGHGPRVRVPAVDGNDVVAYFSLKPGDKDVLGLSSITRYMDSAKLLPPNMAAMHPEPYEFWFSTETNAKLFDANPWAYIPMFGGHCTHGIASRNDLTAELIVDGRVGFTCVNTTKWVVVNGSLYMNSCGMYDDFIKDPAGDIAKATAIWTGWFGNATAIGPVNDACFQDGGKYDGNPIGHLIPPHCVIN